MDELEILKRDWKNKEHSFNRISEKEIYGMLHKRSSSIVKWILVISIVEVLFWTCLTVFTSDEDYFEILEMYHLNKILPVLTIANYVVLIGFIYLFYKNYKTINTIATVKQLMVSILKTRKTVQYYVWYNLAMFFFSFLLVFAFQFKYDPQINEMLDGFVKNGGNSKMFYLFIFAIYFIAASIFVGLIWLFYRLLYGILLKRLYQNYKELEKIDF